MWRNEAERDKEREEWLKICINVHKGLHINLSASLLNQEEEMDAEERNDVYIYRTVRYPPDSTSPTIEG